MKKELGKISGVYFGHGGYQDCCLGIHFTFEVGSGGGVCGDKSYWDSATMECSEHCKWSESDRDAGYAEIMRFISTLLEQSKVDRVSRLKGVPVEMSFDGNMLKDWRILTEVL